MHGQTKGSQHSYAVYNITQKVHSQKSELRPAQISGLLVAACREVRTELHAIIKVLVTLMFSKRNTAKDLTANEKEIAKKNPYGTIRF